jgi:hypothetical protein
MNPQKHKIKHDSPEGRKLCESYQNSDKKLCFFQLSLSNIGERFGLGGMFLCFFLCAKESKKSILNL